MSLQGSHEQARDTGKGSQRQARGRHEGRKTSWPLYGTDGTHARPTVYGTPCTAPLGNEPLDADSASALALHTTTLPLFQKYWLLPTIYWKSCRGFRGRQTSYLRGDGVVREAQPAGLECLHASPQVGQVPDDHEAEQEGHHPLRKKHAQDQIVVLLEQTLARPSSVRAGNAARNRPRRIIHVAIGSRQRESDSSRGAALRCRGQGTAPRHLQAELLKLTMLPIPSTATAVHTKIRPHLLVGEPDLL